MTIEELKKEALRLGSEGRADLARGLLSSLDSLSETEIERLWVEEAKRRDRDLANEAASASSADVVLDRARAQRK